MAKFSGTIGYSITTETSPGVFTPGIAYRPCRGDVISDRRRNDSGSEIIDSLKVTNRFSVVSNLYLLSNLGSMKVITYLGVKWKIASFEYLRPRIIIETGGIYNGD